MSYDKNIRSFLFCPADKEKMFAKALDSEADILIFDLEDAVAAQNKQSARDISEKVPRKRYRVMLMPWLFPAQQLGYLTISTHPCLSEKRQIANEGLGFRI